MAAAAAAAQDLDGGGPPMLGSPAAGKVSVQSGGVDNVLTCHPSPRDKVGARMAPDVRCDAVLAVPHLLLAGPGLKKDYRHMLVRYGTRRDHTRILYMWGYCRYPYCLPDQVRAHGILSSRLPLEMLLSLPGV